MALGPLHGRLLAAATTPSLLRTPRPAKRESGQPPTYPTCPGGFLPLVVARQDAVFEAFDRDLAPSDHPVSSLDPGPLTAVLRGRSLGAAEVPATAKDVRERICGARSEHRPKLRARPGTSAQRTGSRCWQERFERGTPGSGRVPGARRGAFDRGSAGLGQCSASLGTNAPKELIWGPPACLSSRPCGRSRIRLHRGANPRQESEMS